MALQFTPYPVIEQQPSDAKVVTDALFKIGQQFANSKLQYDDRKDKKEGERQQRVMDYLKLRAEYGDEIEPMMQSAGIAIPTRAGVPRALPTQTPVTGAEATLGATPMSMNPVPNPPMSMADGVQGPSNTGSDAPKLPGSTLDISPDFLSNLRKTKGRKGAEDWMKQSQFKTNTEKDLLDLQLKKEQLEKANRGKKLVTRDELEKRPNRMLDPGEELLPNDPLAMQSRNAELNLSNEFSQQSKDFRTAAAALPAIMNAPPDAAGDMQMIYGLMKIYDPNSVVRETEFANAENARGVPEGVRATWNKIVGGERLSQAQREQFKASAMNVYSGRETQHRQLEDEFRRQSAGWGLNPNQVIRDYKYKPASGGAPADRGAKKSGADPLGIRS